MGYFPFAEVGDDDLVRGSYAEIPILDQKTTYYNHWHKRGFGLLRFLMTKDKLIEIIQGLLKTEVDLSFLLQLNESDLETLVACIRDRVEQVGR